MEGQELEKERKKKKEGNGDILFQEDDGKIEIDSKLDQYLSIHSMNLTASVRNYIERSKKGKLSEEESISSLGLVAFERKKFLKTLKAVETKF